jgi:tripartite-type tricarboxylate transporter receptor subunit TctC
MKQGDVKMDKDTRKKTSQIGTHLIGAVALVGVLASSQSAPVLAASWEGKTVKISVGYKPGGGADIMARLLAVHLPKYLPGSPKITVQNRPGGGTQTNARDMLRRPKDGTYIGQFAQTLMIGGVLGTAPKWFKWQSYGYLGMVDGAGEKSFYGLCAHTSKIKNLKDFVEGKKWRWGEISPATGAGKVVVWFSQTRFPIRGFYGYGGSAEVAAAFERGEMDVTSRCNETFAKRYPHWFKENKVVPLFGWGELNPDKHVPPNNALSNGIRDGRWPWFGDMHKTMRKYATKDEWAALDGMLALQGTHVWSLPPGVPSDVTKVMQKGFLDTTKSKKFIADMTKRGRVVAPLSGPDTMKRVQTIQDLSPAGKKVLIEVFKHKRKKKKKKKKKKS